MCTQVIMPLQVNLTSKPGELNSVISTFWPKTPQQQNKFRSIMQTDKNSSKKRRHQSEQSKQQNAISKSPTTPNSSLNKQQQSQSSPFYAGAKFSEAPLPSFLPRPPVSWLPAQLKDLKELDNLNNIANTCVIEKAISILEQDKNTGKSEKSIENGNKSNQTSSSKYYGQRTNERKARSESISSTGAVSIATFQYNFRNTRRNTPQCQTKCKNTRYSSFSRQNIHQKIAAVN